MVLPQWIGGVSNDVTDDLNWSAELAGDGSDWVSFGFSSNYTPSIPATGVALTNIYFNSERGAYTFSGNAEVGSQLLLWGNVILESPGDVTFDSKITVLLTPGSHEISVADYSTVWMNGVVADAEGAASVTKTGYGALVLSGSNTFTGGLSLSSGTLLVGNNSALGTGTLKAYADASLGVTEGGSFTLANTIDLDCSGGSLTINLGCNDSLTLTGVISGNAGLVQTGGTLTLAGANIFQGGVTVQSGAKLQLGGSSTTETIEDGEYSYEEITTSPVGFNDLKLENGSTLALASAGSYNLHNDIDLDCFDGSVKIDTGAGSLSLYGYISGSAGLVKKGSGTLALYDGHNDFSGGVTVKQGTLLLGASSQEWEMEMFSEGGDEETSYASSPVGTGTLKMEAGTTLGLVNDASYLLHNDIDLGCFDGTVTINTGAGDLTLLGYIYGTAGITKTGSGTLTLEHSNEFDGDFVVSNGNVDVNDGMALGYGALVFDTTNEVEVNFNSDEPVIHGLSGNNPNATLNLNGNEYPAGLIVYQSGTSSFAGHIAGDGYLYLTGGGNLTLSGQSTFTDGVDIDGGTTLTLGSSTMATAGVINSGPIGTGTLYMYEGATLSSFGEGITLLNNIVFDGNAESAYYFDIASGQKLTIGDGTLGIISGTGELDKTGLGTLTLNSANTYSGDTLISAGVLEVGNAAALGTGGKVTLDGGALKLINGVTNVTGVTIDFGMTNGGTLSGNWTFNTLQTFGAGVTLAPGNSPGTMTFGAGYAPTGGVTTEFEFASAFGTPGTDWDVISVTGALDLTSISTGNRYNLELISLDGNNTQNMPISGLVATSWVIFKTTTGVTLPGGVLAGDIGTLFNIDSSRFYGGGIFDLMISGNDIVLNFTPVPEPSTYALMALGTALTGLAAWRKRRRA